MAKDKLWVLPFRNADLPYFSALPEAEKKKVLLQFETLIQIAETAHSLNHPINSAKTALWGFAKREGFTFNDDLFEKLLPSDLVDVYSFDHKMIFANFRFFEVVSYSLEELYCRPWTELFSRNRPSVDEQLWKLSQDFASGKHETIVPTDYIPMCIALEIASPEARRILVKPRFFAPFFRDGRPVAYLCANTATAL